MRTRVVMVALTLAVPVSVAAQAEKPVPAQTQTAALAQGRHTFLPQHKSTLSIDFGARKAAKNFLQLPVRCATVRKHPRHELVPVAKGFVEFPFYRGHHRLTAPAPPCPVR